MADRRPQSIYEQLTTPTVPPPDQRVRLHVVRQGESLISISNIYSGGVYDPLYWRLIGRTNGVQNPFTFDRDFLGKAIKIPPKPLPEFL